MDRTCIQQAIPSSAAIAEFAEALGAKGVLSAPEDCARYALDQSGLTGMPPLAVLRPATTAEVAAALAICTRHGIAVVPQGGRTGLSGGACSPAGAVVLSTERMSGVIEVDPDAMTLTAWAGTPLETVQEAARAAGLDYPVDIGARGSATIGGTIATNAGGIRVLQHGMTRANVLGLEAVLADGAVISRLGKTVKDNSGFDLKQVFIGSEGTLGVVTRAVLQLRQPGPQSALALLALPSHDAALACLGAGRKRFGARLAPLPQARGTLKVGHVGDGNVHLLVAHDGSAQAEARIEAEIYALLRDWDGAVTAEHGIGRIKAQWIGHSRSNAEVAMMRALKTQLNPLGLLNPGAVFA
ncbi:FAD-binding oxidoreductase [Tropicibacter naphthalenivorans]|uniref:Putative FAD-linked oxidoreductase n=1 Tax=Tropicibacter naphthalenivorans TaxID=441103 RepID=A0A0P1GY15_9RHOB|nr:FAD-binding oxidoreductase [Tropicibacter naphthalenivorans]CUH80661.1 putative FAD-linked oxidoreductase [Tropicibacter naphthalenivorans]SMC89217.1 FAD linked oxidases, C-terminal domain [Tropicibacter naphthalenivorans]